MAAGSGRRRRAPPRERPLPQGGGDERPAPSRSASSPTPGPRSSSTTPSARPTAPTPRPKACRTTSRRRVAGLLMEKELRYLGMALDGARAALRGHARRGQGLGQDPGHREPAAARGRAPGRRRHGLHVLPAQGLATGKSLVEEDKVDARQALLEKAEGKIRLPVDHVVAAAFKADAEREDPARDRDPRRLDGPRHRPEDRARLRRRASRAAKIVLWNGPMGVFEMAPFAEGTLGHGAGAGREPRHDRSWAAATAWPRSPRWAWPTRSTTSRRAAAPRSSSWPASRSPGVACLQEA